ncbi:MAG: AMP-binding protein [Pseudomonadota bacterium]
MADTAAQLELWAGAATCIDWFSPYIDILDEARKPLYRWFPGATCNTSYNCLDRHVRDGRGNQTAIIYDSPVAGITQHISYNDLLNRVSRMAGALNKLGIEKGDRVIIYMPMVPEAVIAMQACARIGAVHSVVFGGFAANELASRIDDCTPKLIISASCGIEPSGLVPYKPLLDQALQVCAHKPESTIILQREQLAAELLPGRDLDWVDVEASGEPVLAVHVGSTDPLYIIYTSGTTGQPKGVVRDNGSHLVALNWSMVNIYDIDPGDVFWAASDIGWVVGHSYIVYGPLIRGATTILFEGKPVGTPDAATYWRTIERHGVKVMFTAPTAIRAIKREDSQGKLLKKFDLSSLETLFLAGERADPDTIQWAENHLQRPVIDHWWQTELGWPAVANCAGIGLFPVKYGSSGKAVPGFEIEALDEAGQSLPHDTLGALALKLPLPPGALTTLWNNDEGFIEKYLTEFPGYYSTGDAGFIDSEEYVHIMSRTDDVINVAGHRLSTGQMEEVIADHPDVAECAVFGISDELKGQVPLALLILNQGTTKGIGQVEAEVISSVREIIGPVAALKRAYAVSRLPKTRSGKILRATLQKIADGEAYNMPATIDDPAILKEIQAELDARA